MKRSLSRITGAGLMLFAFIFLLQCEEAYSPELSVNSNALVVQAILTNEIKKQTIILTQSDKYSHSHNFSGISGAEVYITQGNEVRFNFIDCGSGYYTSENVLNFETGREYILHIITSDGISSSSSPQTFEKVPELDSVFITPETANKEYINLQGKRIYREIDGFSIHAVFSGNEDDSEYLAYQINGYEQYFLIFRKGFSQGYSYLFCRRSTKFNLFNITSICNTKSMKKTGTNTRVAAYYQDYLNLYRGPSSEEDDATNQSLLSSGFRGMLIEVRQLSLTKEIYNILQLAENQSNSEYKLFDPVMVQVPSNISCETQPGKRVFGAFMVSDVSKKYVFITYDAERKEMDIKQIDNMPGNISMGCVTDQAPADWIFPGSLE